LSKRRGGGKTAAMSRRDPAALDPARFPHWADDVVRFSDQDGAGHVNNTAIAVYVETGRLAFVHELILAERRRGDRFVAARVSIDYLREAHWPGRIRIGTRVSRVGQKSATLEHLVLKDGEPIAFAECVIAFMAGPKTADLPADVRARLEAVGGQDRYP
jgi:acyl-CoA thioester hydrolase